MAKQYRTPIQEEEGVLLERISTFSGDVGEVWFEVVYGDYSVSYKDLRQARAVWEAEVVRRQCASN